MKDIPEFLEDEVGGAEGWERLKKEVEKEDLREAARLFQALSDPKRLMILKALEKQRLCVCMMVDLIGLPYSRVSYHAVLLKKAGLAVSERRGNYFIYSITERGREALNCLGKLG